MTDFKVAIATWYNYRNYGTALQATAMTEAISKLGGSASMIAYKPKGTRIIPKKLTLADIFKRGLGLLFRDRKNRPCFNEKQEELFSSYLRLHINETQACTSHSELASLSKEFDAIICGSDQIWSPLCYDSKYFLDFVEDTNKMIAYAPSIGSPKISNPVIKERMIQHISRFSHLSIREQQGAELIEELTQKKAEVVLDPTLLMNSSEWDKHIEDSSIPALSAPKYIVCYFLGNSSKYMGYVKALSKKAKMPFFIIPVTQKQKNSKESVPFDVGPQEFISLIKNASYVCTDSFHGMAFSINYNIPFSVFKRFTDKDPKNQNSRIFSLLKQVGLEQRLVDYKKHISQAPFDCDFTESNSKLLSLRENSLSFLSNALSLAIADNNQAFDTAPYKITDRCCGCGACATVCKLGAVSIQKNQEGFDHYLIDNEKCVRCGQCRSVCPMNDVVAPGLKNAKSLNAIKSRSAQTLSKSSSGGVGHELASHLSDLGYAICGCAYDSTTNSAKHIWILPNEKENLHLLQGSKYIQSETSEAISKLDGIIKDMPIAFFGTPCQGAAFDKLLRKKGLRDKAIIIDLICHGVPTIHLWNKYLADINKKHKTGSFPSVSFRAKKYNWRSLTMEISGNAHSYVKNERKDDFYAFFRRGLCYMEACSDCPYRERSAADLRIGDYWGPRYQNDTQGVSMVMANTDASLPMIEFLRQDDLFEFCENDLKEYWTVQGPYNPQRPLIREQLIEELKSETTSLSHLRKKYCGYYDQAEKINDILRFLKKVLKK